jgi:hypothetical protein
MTGPLKLARALAPAALVGLMCGGAPAGTHPGSPARVADPCSPDGTCLPRWETWGVYQTRWRPFPGDVVGGVPTPAEQEEPEVEEDGIGGPTLPGPDEEGLMGPTPSEGPGVLPGAVAPEGAPPEGAAPGGAAPGGAAPEGGPAVPPADALPVPEVGPAPAEGADPLDPFGAAPPAPPAWMFEPVEGVSYTPSAAPAIVNPAALETSDMLPPVLDGPNLNGDDSPPALPASLQDALGLAPRPAWSTAAATTTLAQPPTVRLQPRPAVDAAVVPASAETTLGMPLINPAAALATEAGAEGLQQAIYIEASDQAAEAPAKLPPVAPEN